MSRTVEELEGYIADLEVQLRFWRQCAEHAVTGWNALEDKVAVALEALGARDEAPPAIVEELVNEIEIGGRVLRVVEDEVPVGGKT